MKIVLKSQRGTLNTGEIIKKGDALLRMRAAAHFPKSARAQVQAKMRLFINHESQLPFY